MTYGIAIVFFSFTLSVAYICYRYTLGRIAIRELQKEGISVGKTISFFANPETLEYRLRLAMAVSEMKNIPVVVSVPGENQSESLYIIQAFQKKYQNLTYRMV